MIINIRELRKREEQGLIVCQKHPTLLLLIWNYSNECQFSKDKWDEYTLMARGLITDPDGNIIARPFRKFFSINEVEETKVENLPADIPEVREKYDGSIGISYPDGDNISIATRGSFTSDQALWATEWIHSRFNRASFKEGFTYLFEIIYPENRVVVDYGNMAECVLLAVKSIEDGHELSLEEEATRLELSHPRRIYGNLRNLQARLKKMDANEEGFVLKYPNGLMVKMKCSEYLRLHRLLIGFSAKELWLRISTGQGIEDILVNTPDEFYQWATELQRNLKESFEKLYEQAYNIYNSIRSRPTRKEQAEYLLINHKDLAPMVFRLLDGQSPDKIIWERVKPKGERVFKKET